MRLVERIKNILLTPKTEWPVIQGEATDTLSLYKGYVIPLAALGAVAAFISIGVVGISIPFLGTHRSLGGGISAGLSHFVLGLISVYLIALLINALAPTFNSQASLPQALKVAAYSYTPAWIAAVLQILPGSTLLVFLGSLYGFYLLYLGIQTLMQTPAEKAIPYTVVVVICAFVLSLIIGAIAGRLSYWGAPSLGTLTQSEYRGPGSANDKLAQLEAFGKKMEAANEKLEAANKTGDVNQQMAAASTVLGTLAGGGSNVEPLDLAQLKTFLPESLGNFKRQEIAAQKNGMLGINASHADAKYSDEQGRTLRIALTDTGGAKGLAMLAGFGLVESEKETASGYEKTGKSSGGDFPGYYREKFNKAGTQTEFTTIVGERFMVEADGRGIEMATLKLQLKQLNLAGLAALKNQGSQAK